MASETYISSYPGKPGSPNRGNQVSTSLPWTVSIYETQDRRPWSLGSLLWTIQLDEPLQWSCGLHPPSGWYTSACATCSIGTRLYSLSKGRDRWSYDGAGGESYGSRGETAFRPPVGKSVVGVLRWPDGGGVLIFRATDGRTLFVCQMDHGLDRGCVFSSLFGVLQFPPTIYVRPWFFPFFFPPTLFSAFSLFVMASYKDVDGFEWTESACHIAHETPRTVHLVTKRIQHCWIGHTLVKRTTKTATYRLQVLTSHPSWSSSIIVTQSWH